MIITSKEANIRTRNTWATRSCIFPFFLLIALTSLRWSVFNFNSLNDHVHNLSSFPFQDDFFPIWFNIHNFSLSIHVYIPLNLFLSREGGRKLTFILYLLLTQSVFGTWHILCHLILSTILGSWNYYSHSKDEKLMARNQHAQGCLIKKWQSKNSNKTILFLFFFKWYCIVYFQAKILQETHRNLGS